MSLCGDGSKAQRGGVAWNYRVIGRETATALLLFLAISQLLCSFVVPVTDFTISVFAFTDRFRKQFEQKSVNFA